MFTVIRRVPFGGKRQSIGKRVFSSSLSYENVHFIETSVDAISAAKHLQRSPLAVVDCEGVQLGRFGQLCLVQIATKTDLFLCDALQPGVVQGFAPWLSSGGTLKVMHDCREDSSALFHQHGVLLDRVFDTQVAYSQYLRRSKQPNHQISLAGLAKRLGAPEVTTASTMKALMEQDTTVWRRRPIEPELLLYAAQDVSTLWDVHKLISQEPFAAVEDLVVTETAETAIAYCHLNSDVASPSDVCTQGKLLDALVAARLTDKIIFKLNAGSGRMGLVSGDLAMRRFVDVDVGDVVSVAVAGSNRDGSVVYLERFEEPRHWGGEEGKAAMVLGRRFETGRRLGVYSSTKVDPLMQREGFGDDEEGEEEEERNPVFDVQESVDGERAEQSKPHPLLARKPAKKE